MLTPAKTHARTGRIFAEMHGNARHSHAPKCVVATPHGLVLVLVLVTRRCARVCQRWRGRGRGAEIRRQNALHRASIAHHHRAATATATPATAAIAATALRGPAEMAHLERRTSEL